MIRVGEISIPWGQSMFPDHSLLIKLDPDKIIAFKDTITIKWLYEGDSELFTLICVKRHIDYHCHGVDVVLDMPYIPHARMDRVKAREDVFTLKYFAEIINSLNFKRVFVRDAHSNVSLALINNVYDWGVRGYIEMAVEKSGAEVLFFPDEGAMKRYSEQSPMPYAFGMKKRDWQTGKILGLDVINAENIVGKDVLIVDDICSRGGTFYHSAKALKAAGAKSVSLYVTHLEETVTLGEMAASDGLVDHIYTTESIFPAKLCESNHGYDPYWAEWITIMK
jgi:ribose-phosphate pyrophosphokinase